MTILSSQTELQTTADLLKAVLVLPFFRTMPGSVVEHILASVHAAEVLSTYDFIDIIDRQRNIGWTIKTTEQQTPLTWKRAKISNKEALISASLIDDAGRKQLGDAILNFCNAHAIESINRYRLEHLLYARLIDHGNKTFTYFERLLPSDGIIFNPDLFEWRWSKERSLKTKKEQLTALHGFHIETGQRWFAWHGRGENQLHFTGERNWWPDPTSAHQITFESPSRKLTFNELRNILARIEEQS